MQPKIYDELKEIAPHVAFSTCREIDTDHDWDGDGPDPTEDGYDNYFVTITACIIYNGEYLRGYDSILLYMKPEEEITDVNGYLHEMLRNAVQDLLNLGEILSRDSIYHELKEAKYHIIKTIRDSYEASVK